MQKGRAVHLAALNVKSTSSEEPAAYTTLLVGRLPTPLDPKPRALLALRCNALQHGMELTLTVTPLTSTKRPAFDKPQPCLYV